MNRVNNTAAFEISVTGREDGAIGVAYIRLKKGRVARTREIDGDALLADYDARGNLIGIEVLAPVRIPQLVGLVDENRRPSFRRFVRQCFPRGLLAA